MPWLIQLVLRWDGLLQLLGVLLSCVGLVSSGYLIREAWLDRKAVAHNGLIEQIVARSHLRSQVVIGLIQLGFGIVSLLVLHLPPLPSEMGDRVHWDYVLFVIGTRKVIRLSVIAVLMWAGWRQAADRRQVLTLLQERQP